ncbi:3'-5' exonuclease [Amycolatopsis pigmentata]|uniref:PolC-type DNA polymerase III n=1 Tax=Amycolatopsis pigmentata TaxID=450801 RepID=A0ABW5G699_9PSEU
MGQQLINALQHVTPVVIDFEYTTPAGAPPGPIEVAVQALRARNGKLERAAKWEALMRPPASAPLTTFDTAQTGITPQMLADQPPASEVLAELDRRFTAGPYLLVAHHAPAEAKILSAYREHCPNLARIDFIDTVRLARDLYPELRKHGLDDLIRHLAIPMPPNRHRAMADVLLTTELFILMVTDSGWSDLRQLRRLAGLAADAAQPEQTSLFG